MALERIKTASESNLRTVNVCLEHRFYEYKGKYYTKLAFPFSYWKDYLSYFDKVVIVARVQKCNVFDPLFVRVDGDNVSVYALPYYQGIKQFSRKLFPLIRAAYSFVKKNEYFILRTGNVTNMFWLFIVLRNKRYLREYPGNIKQGIIGFVGNKPHVIVLASFLQFIARIQARFSIANSYVSRDCQKLYSSSNPSFIFSSFNVSELPDICPSRVFDSEVLEVISVGRLEGEKGHEDLIKAVAMFNNNSARPFEIRLTIIGSGSRLEYLKSLVSSIGLNCSFLGAITDRNKLFNYLVNSDLFCIPSHTEGMPRALLEAMGMGLPCIGSNVGGIPEILSSDWCFTPNSPQSICDMFQKFSKLDNFNTLGEHNRKLIHESYSVEKMSQEKITFWSKLYE
ncbi:glycosyltransferase [Shewanella insulae]|uniref:glycosyltransferase n=1 Tax=Shewanella insulae TaxID=2681496 RepID=UPI001EFCE6B3|nr:glycosyltransferase [Shewanella insulae]MCG9714998.1 glycosyltransferase [Shewanella insulae]